MSKKEPGKLGKLHKKRQKLVKKYFATIVVIRTKKLFKTPYQNGEHIRNLIFDSYRSVAAFAKSFLYESSLTNL